MSDTYYRTYIIEFDTKSMGTVVYAGMHASKYSNPLQDPYYGSGKVIKAAVKKYGKACINSIRWFEHESDEAMCFAEIVTIDHLKAAHGKQCVNIAEGGIGGNLRTLSPEQEESRVRNMLRTRALPDVKARHIKSLKAAMATQEYKDKVSPIRSKITKRSWERNREGMVSAIWSDSARTKRAETLKDRMRDTVDPFIPSDNFTEEGRLKGVNTRRLNAGKHWQDFDILYEVWLHNPVGSARFSKIAIALGYPDVRYDKLVRAFKAKHTSTH